MRLIFIHLAKFSACGICDLSKKQIGHKNGSDNARQVGK